MNLVKKILIVISIAFGGFTLSGCGLLDDNEIVIAEGSWQSNKFHDQVAKFIIEEGYGATVDIIPADAAIMVTSIKSGDVDLTMEFWSDNIITYDDDIAAGSYEKLSTNFDDNMQGLYIPTYMTRDSRFANLTSVDDLKDYAQYFPNPEGGSKGIIYGGPASWAATMFLEKKMELYGLDEKYTFTTIDSSAALNATLAAAYANQEPWVGYNWEPTSALGKYDMTLLTDSDYSVEDFEVGRGEFPSVEVNVVVTPGFTEDYPEITAFLRNYNTSSAITSEVLAYIEDNELEPIDGAIYFLRNHESIWSDWVTDEAYNQIKAALDRY